MSKQVITAGDKQVDLAFQKAGYLVRLLAATYLILRFSDPVAAYLLAGVQVELSAELLFGMVAAVVIAICAVRGYVKLAGGLCLLTPLLNMGMLIQASPLYAGGMFGMLQTTPAAMFVLVQSVLGAVVAIWLLVDHRLAAYGKQRRKLRTETGGASEAETTAEENAEGVLLWNEYRDSKKRVRREESRQKQVQRLERMTRRTETLKAEQARLAAESAQRKLDQEALKVQAAEEKSRLAAESAQRRLEQEAKEAQAEERRVWLMKEFPGEASTLCVFHKKALGRRNMLAETWRLIVAKKYGCAQESMDKTTGILLFPSGGKMLVGRDAARDCLYIESDTRHYGKEFHKLALEAIAYGEKNLGLKPMIIDRSGFYPNGDEESLSRYFDP